MHVRGDLHLDATVFSCEGEPVSCSRSGRCCHNHAILLTCHDARRLATVPVVAADPEQFIVLYMAHEGYKDAETLAQFPAVNIDGDPCHPGLRFVEVELELRRCPFLEPSTGTCTIHELKPMACRTYPFVLDGNVITRVDRPRCTRPYHPASPVETRALLSLMHVARVELQAHARFASWWNGTGSGDFLRAFLNL